MQALDWHVAALATTIWPPPSPTYSPPLIKAPPSWPLPPPPQADCPSSQLEAADATSTARARAVHCGKAAALATRGGTALASADGGSTVSQADGPAAAATKSSPGSAMAVAVAGPGGKAAGDARA